MLEVLAAATSRLRDAGCDTPRLDAELLLASALGCDRAALYTGPSVATVPPAFDELLRRRSAREPIAYIVGYKAFRRVTLRVDQRVLIPRPETELLVEVGLGLPFGARVVDAGTGSGAVALALKDERPDLEVVGTDPSDVALEVARANASRLALDVGFVHGDLLAGVGADAVLANLPYVGAREELPPEIARYEPSEALYAGEDGLAVIRRLLEALPPAVSLVACEVAPHQAGWLARRLAELGWRSIEVLRDLAGHERVVVGGR